ncbi:transcriptional repressor [Candidatus Dojkabacteria bacterium]|nr:transcriptional repressor [Candidatus Dojkabacteria bacterium]
MYFNNFLLIKKLDFYIINIYTLSVMNTIKERNTIQKKLIIDFLSNTKSHPTAYEIYDEVKKKIPNVSKGTIYRNLKKLKKESKVKEIYWDVAHFDGNTDPHGHFICSKCDQIRDIEDIQVNLRKLEHYGKIDSFDIYIYGICNDCI